MVSTRAIALGIAVLLVVASAVALVEFNGVRSGALSSSPSTSSTGPSNTSTETSSSGSSSSTSITSYSTSSSSYSQPPTFYVATNGNDAWSGTMPVRNKEVTDGPFATLARAQQALRVLRATHPSLSIPLIVQVEAGTYILNSALTFDAADSGTAASPTVFEAAPNATVLVSGGRQITGWSQIGPNRWSASVAGFQYFEQLWVDGNRAYRPYTTEGKYLYFVGPIYSDTRSSSCNVQMGSKYECFNRFLFKPGDLASGYHNINDVEVADFECWTVPVLRLSAVFVSNDTAFTTGTTSRVQNCHGFMAGHRYLLENVKEALSQRGQWYLDRSNASVAYVSATGENPNNETFIAPQLGQLIVGTGVSYLTFVGLTFSYTNWVVPAAGWPSPQGEELAPVMMLPSALSFTGSSYIVIDHSTVSHIGAYAISFTGTAPFTPSQSLPYDNVVTNDRIFDAGGGGIVVGRAPMPNETDANVAQFTLIQNDEITGLSRFLPGAYGIYVLNSHNNVISHNTVSDVYSNGISEGATYAYNIGLPQLAHDNLIEFNLVYDINEGVAEDGGAIYTASGSAQGDKVLNNVVHDVTAYLNVTTHGYGGWGIYFDSTSQNVYAANNLVYRTSFPSIHQNDGFNNTVTNSILAFGNLGIIDRTHNNASSLTVTHNIIFWDINSAQGSFQRGVWTCVGTCTSQFLFADNLYWYLKGTPSFITTTGNGQVQSLTHAQWQALGEDSGSMIADPMFVGPNYPADNFTLPANSPALGIGFAPFDPSLAGIIPGSLPANPVIPAAFPLQLFNPHTGF